MGVYARERSSWRDREKASEGSIDQASKKSHPFAGPKKKKELCMGLNPRGGPALPQGHGKHTNNVCNSHMRDRELQRVRKGSFPEAEKKKKRCPTGKKKMGGERRGVLKRT